MDRVFTYARRMPRRANDKKEASTASTTAKVLGTNIAALMAAHKELNSNPKLAKKTGLGTATLSRVRNGEVDANLDTLERLAKAFHIEAWQLLVPRMEPNNLPALQAISPEERRLYERLREVAKELKDS
jgi:transcriptional regulator with XRE-family HTH domain